MDSLKIKQASRRIEALRSSLKEANVKPGWIQYMRNVMNLKLKDLARLTSLSPQTITETEKRETEGKVTINTLKKMANAMDCELVYAFIPKIELSDLLKNRAHEKAKKIILSSDVHMELEDQKVQVDREERIQRLATKLLEKGDVW